MIQFDTIQRSRLVGLALILSILSPAALVPAAHAQVAPELSSKDAVTRRPWFARQMGALMSIAPDSKDATRTALVAEVNKRVHDQSDATRATLKARQAQGFKTIVDVVVVGGGIHSAIFNSTMSHAFPEARVLTLEGSDTLIKTFTGAGPVFRINSPELGTATANLIAEAPLQLAQISPAKFANAELLGQVALFALFHSTTNFLLSAKVAAITPDGDRYIVKLEEGLTVYARHVVVATGLGIPSLKSDDQETMRIVRAEASRTVDLGKEVPDIQFFDDAIAKAKLSLDMGLAPLDSYAGKRVAVVGAGDAGNVWVEFLLGHAPPEVYARAKVQTGPAHSIWLGQKAKTIDEWKAANKPRYYETLQGMYQDPRIEMTGARLESIRYAAGEDAKKGKFVITANGDNGAETIYADKIVMSTGYQNVAPKLVEQCGAMLKPMNGTVKGIDKPTPLCKQCADSDGKGHPVYIVGPAAMPLAPDDELKLTITKNPASINVLGPRTEGLALLIAASLMGQ